MPKLWSDSLESHRRAVHDAILDATAALVAQHGVTEVTMSQIATAARIGRATLYKYFSDVATILSAWHERHIGTHLEQLAAIALQAAPPLEKLDAVLFAYVRASYEHEESELVVSLHGGEHVVRARHRLGELLEAIIREGIASAVFRDDVPPAELANYCLSALGAAAALRSKAALRRLVTVTIDGLRQRPNG